MFNTAHIGDTVRHCRQTFGLRPAEDWSEPVKVVEVTEDYYGQTVTVETGEVLVSSLHHMSVVQKAS